MALRARVRSDNTWPGFVDALSTLLLAIIFLLVVFVLSHFVLNQALTGRDEELSRLTRQIAELSELLALEQEATSEMRTTVSQLSASLQESTRARDLLTLRIDDLTLEIERITARAEQAEGELLAARQIIEADRDKIELQLREVVSLRRDIEALREVRAALEQRVADLAATVEARDRDIGALRDRTKELEAELASEEERTLLAQREIAAREVRIEELVVQANLARDEVASEREVSARARSQIDLLNQQIAALRQQLLRLEAALEASEAKDKEQQTTIADLGRRLNVALARRVEELSKYRSEFFGRLREVLGDRADITVVGDRFVFQSEVLFETGSADLGAEGQVQLTRFADTLREISANIPDDIPWIIRVDGHTDLRPIFTNQFPSNWELSTGRAIAVTRFLQARGIPPERLAAAGFGEFQPLDPREDEIAFRRNRRIELKLTER